MANNQGIQSKNVRQTPIKTGSGSTGIRPSYTNAPGSHFGDHTTDGKSTGYRGPKREDGKSFQPVRFGNEVALNVGKGGPGTGRTTYATGTQDQHGQPAPGNPPAQRHSFD
jgi:hypothetical protein